METQYLLSTEGGQQVRAGPGSDESLAYPLVNGGHMTLPVPTRKTAGVENQWRETNRPIKCSTKVCVA